MVALLGFMVVVTLVMWLVPESPAGKLFYRQMVQRPLQAAANFQRHHLLYVVILAAVMIAGGEMLALFGPEFFAVYALDLAIYFDAVIVTYALSAVARMRAGWVYLRGLAQRPARRISARRRRRSGEHGGRLRNPANDDDAHPAMLAA